jgi:hypothetical protein
MPAVQQSIVRKMDTMDKMGARRRPHNSHYALAANQC